MDAARALVFLSVRGRYDLTVSTVAGVLERAGEPVSLCLFDDRSDGADGDLLVERLYRNLHKSGMLAYLAFNTERTTGPAPWGKAVVLAQFARLLDLPEFRGRADLFAVVDNDVDLAPGWLATGRRALGLAEERWPGRVAFLSVFCSAPSDHPDVAPTGRYELAPDLAVVTKKCEGGACWLARPDFFRRYGLPDQSFAGDGGEDVDYGRRITSCGDVIVCLDSPLAFHANDNPSARRRFQRRVDPAVYRRWLEGKAPQPAPGPLGAY